MFKNFLPKTLAITLLVFALSIPNNSSAYWTTNQAAIRVNDNNLLFLIEYRFGLKSQSLAMPIGAVRNISEVPGEINSPYLNYTLMDDGEVVYTGGKASALVLSGIKVSDGQYYTYPGQGAKYTLMVLLTLDEAEVMSNEDLSLQVTHLPFVRTSEESEAVFKDSLNPSELSNYVTPEIDL